MIKLAIAIMLFVSLFLVVIVGAATTADNNKLTRVTTNWTRYRLAVVEIARAEKPTNDIYIEPRDTFNFDYVKDVEIGLRSDGVVVWRKINNKGKK